MLIPNYGIWGGRIQPPRPTHPGGSYGPLPPGTRPGWPDGGGGTPMPPPNLPPAPPISPPVYGSNPGPGYGPAGWGMNYIPNPNEDINNYLAWMMGGMNMMGGGPPPWAQGGQGQGQGYARGQGGGRGNAYGQGGPQGGPQGYGRGGPPTANPARQNPLPSQAQGGQRGMGNRGYPGPNQTQPQVTQPQPNYPQFTHPYQGMGQVAPYQGPGSNMYAPMYPGRQGQ